MGSKFSTQYMLLVYTCETMNWCFCSKSGIEGCAWVHSSSHSHWPTLGYTYLQYSRL